MNSSIVENAGTLSPCLEPRMIGIQSGGPSIHDGITLDVNTHEFDITEEEETMAASEELSNDEEGGLEQVNPIKTVKDSEISGPKTMGNPASDNTTVKHPMTADEFIQLQGGDEAMKRIFDQWMKERMPQLTAKVREGAKTTGINGSPNGDES